MWNPQQAVRRVGQTVSDQHLVKQCCPFSAAYPVTLRQCLPALAEMDITSA